MRKSVRKINNLKNLLFLKANEEKQIDTKKDKELFRKIFKVNQKGLNYDS